MGGDASRDSSSFLAGLKGSALMDMRDTVEYEGEILDDAESCLISFPGKYPEGWYAAMHLFRGSTGFVFLTGPQNGLGWHMPDPENLESPCYCHRIYGKRSWK